jgi:hypothetical protein
VKIERDTSLREVAFVVCTAFDRIGVTAILTGGSAATVYAPEAHQSRDLDFILSFRSPDAGPDRVLADLGYREDGGVYVHTANPLTLDFPKGPLAVGGDLVDSWATLEEVGRVLHLLHPTDCCRDRLAGFLFWDDRGSLAQAVAVALARREEVDLDAVRDWCGREGVAGKYEQFARALRGAGGGRPTSPRRGRRGRGGSRRS